LFYCFASFSLVFRASPDPLVFTGIAIAGIDCKTANTAETHEAIECSIPIGIFHIEEYYP
jgi:hypothetical protein